MAQQQGTVISALSFKAYANGVQVGYGTGMRISTSWSNAQVKVLGRAPAREIVPVGLDVSVSIEMFFLFQQSPMTLGFAPRGNTSSIVNFDYIDFAGLHIDDDSPIVQAIRCKPNTLEMGVNQGGIMGANMTFTATTYSDDNAIALES